MDVRKKTDGRAGFTLTEVMIASGLMMFLSLAIFESVLFCNRLAFDIKSRLAADAIAFDTVWEIFNRQLSWFRTDRKFTQPGNWEVLSSDLSDVWGDKTDEVLVFTEVIPMPEGAPTNWTIRVQIQWPDLAGGGMKSLPRGGGYYEVNRLRTNRNLFRARR